MIRSFEDADGDRCREIFEKCLDRSVLLEEPIKQSIKNYLLRRGCIEEDAKKHPVFVFEQNGTILGLGGIEDYKIKKMYVDPDFHSRGIGSQLLAFIEERAREKGLSELVAHAYLNSISFYHRNGYKISGTYTYHYDVDITLIEMRKDI